MYRMWGLYTLTTALILFVAASAAGTGAIVQPLLQSGGWIRPMGIAALISMDLWILYALWRTLSRFSVDGGSKDLTAILIVLAGGILFVGSITAIVWFGSDRLIVMAPWAVLLIGLTLLNTVRVQLDIQRRRVQGGTVAVIQRHGVFHRLEDPGPIWLIGRSDDLAYTLPTMAEQKSIVTDPLHQQDLTYGYVWCVHYRLNPHLLATPNDEHLQGLLSQPILRQIIKAAIEEGCQQIRRGPEDQNSTEKASDWFETLLTVIPETPSRKQLLAEIGHAISTRLAQKGIETDPEQMPWVQALQLPQNLIEALTAAEFRRQMEVRQIRLAGASVSQLHAWIAQARPMALAQPGDFASTAATRAVEPMQADDRVAAQARASQPSPPDNETPAAAAPNAPQTDNVDAYDLSAEDLSILKRLPE